MTALYHPGLVQVVPQYNINAPHVAANVLYFESALSGLTYPQLGFVQSTFDTHWSTLWKEEAATSTHYLGSIVTDMSSNIGLQVTNAGFTPIPGLGTGQEVTDSVAILFSLKTVTRYRGGHGRIYMPGASQSVLMADGRSIQAGELTNMRNNWLAMNAAMQAIDSASGGPFHQVVWHKVLSTAPNTTESVQDVVVQPILASQRRRLRKVTRHKRRI